MASLAAPSPESEMPSKRPEKTGLIESDIQALTEYHERFPDMKTLAKETAKTVIESESERDHAMALAKKKDRENTDLREENMVKDTRLNVLDELNKTDELTEIYNRKGFVFEMAREMDRVQRGESKPFSLIMIDIDHFKEVNDKYGHESGDAMLKKVASILNSSDVKRINDIVVRWGGEEFIIILPNTNTKDARIVAERLREVIEKEAEIETDKGPLKKTISLGVATFDEKSMPSATEVREKADKALYFSKDNGRNQVSYFQDGEIHSAKEKVSEMPEVTPEAAAKELIKKPEMIIDEERLKAIQEQLPIDPNEAQAYIEELRKRNLEQQSKLS